MSAELDTVTRGGGGRSRARVLVGTVIGLLVLVPAVVIAVRGHAAELAGPSGGPAVITLRAVQSSVAESCSLPHLTSAQAGSACDTSGTHTYVLGAPLGTARVEEAGPTGAGDPPGVRVRVDAGGAATLSDVTGRLVGQRFAVLVDGVVLVAPTVAGPIDTAELVLAASSRAEAASWVDLLMSPPEG